MGWKKKTLIVVGGLLLLYTLAGFLVIPLVTEAVLPDKLSGHLNRPVEVEDISLNPYTLSIAVKGLRIGEKSGPEAFVAFDELFINLQWISLFKLGLVSKEIRLKQPSVRVARISQSEFNFSDLIPAHKEAPSQAPEDEASSLPLHFSLSNIKIIGGNFEFHDRPMDKTHRFADVSFTVPQLSNFESNIDAYTRSVLDGELNDTRLEVDVSSKPFTESLETIVDISLTGVDLPYYFAYVPGALGFDITAGRLDIESKVSFKKQSDGETKLEISGIADLTGFKAADTTSGEILSLPELHMEMAPSEPLAKHIRLAAVSLTEPVVTMARDRNGNLNLAELGPEKDKNAKAPKEDQSKAESESDPFIFELDKLNLTSGTLRYQDFAAPGASAPPDGGPVQMTVNDLNLTVTSFSTQKDQRAAVDFSARLDPDAMLSVKGAFGVTPLTVDTAVTVEDLPLDLAQPYFPDSLKLAVTSGSVDLSGNARMNSDPEAGLSGLFKGDAGIKALTILESQTEEDFLKWQALDLNGIDVSLNPSRIRLKTIVISGLTQNLIVQENGRLNVSEVYTAEAAESEAPEKSAAEDKKAGAKKSEPEKTEAKPTPFPVSIGEIQLRDIGVSFADYSIEPNYTARLTFDEGSITGLSTEAFEGANVSLKGAVNERAPIDISGRINPLLADLLLDISVTLENMELSQVSAYSGKYIGKVIEKGKLNLDLEYSIEDKKLEAENQVLLDQFNLGHRVESEAAVNLPVGLAIALLKDRKGEINLDLPVSGRLDDPQFNVSGVIIQSLKNLVAKAATSPFALVSQIVPGGEELRYIEFEAGSADLSGTSKDKLDAIITLLHERPALNLELTGFVAPEKDRAALKAAALERKVRAAKWAETSEQTETETETIPYAEIDLTEEEFLQYLRQVYRAEVLAAPDAPEDDKLLDDESLTADEMAAEIRQRIEVKDARLRLLSRNRVESVKSYILSDDRIADKRLFIREAKSLTPPDNDEFKDSRVELGLN